MNTQEKLRILDVLRLFRLGLLPSWMWEHWKPHSSSNAADKAPSFRALDFKQRAAFWFAVLAGGLLGLDSFSNFSKICLYIAFVLGVTVWLPIFAGLVHWAWNVTVFYKASGLSLMDMLRLDRDSAENLATRLLVSQAWRTLGMQREAPSHTESREKFGSLYQTFLRLTLVDPSSGWKPYFDQGEEMLKKRGWRGVHRMDITSTVAYGEGKAEL